MTTDREDLYRQATRAYDSASVNLADCQGVRAVVDLVLDARDDRQPWEVLREAISIATNYAALSISDLEILADEWEDKSAQEKATAEAAQELIEQAAQVLRNQSVHATYANLARALADAGFLSAPTTDGGAA